MKTGANAGKWRQVRAGAFIALVLRAGLLLVGLGITAILARALGTAGFGSYLLVLQVVVLGSSFSLAGTDTSLQRYLAVAASHSDWRGIRLILLRSSKLFGAGLVLVGIVLAAFWKPFCNQVLAAPELVPLGAGIFLLVLFNDLENLGSAFFRSVGRPVRGLLILGWPKQLLFLLSILFFLGAGGLSGLESAVLLRIGAAGLAAFLVAGLVLHHLSKRRAGSGEQAPRTRELAATSLPMLGSQMASTLSASAGLWVLGFLAGTESVGVFGAALRLATLSAMVSSAVNLVLPPHLAALHATGQRSEIETLMRRAASWSAGGVLLLFLAYLGFGRWILGGFFGPGFLPAYSPLLLLAGGHLVNVAAGSAGFLLQMTGHQRVLLKISLFTLLIGILLHLILISLWGVMGAAMAQFLFLFMKNACMVTACRRLLGIRTYIRFGTGEPARGAGA